MEDLFEQLQDDTRSFWQSPSSIQRLGAMPSATAFFREYVATSTPVIISGGASGWKAAHSWDNLASLAEDNPELEVTVDFTPDGRGDCVVDLSNVQKGRNVNGAEVEQSGDMCSDGPVFVKPEERRIKFKTFVGMLSTAAESMAAATEGSFGRGGSSSGDSCEGVPYLSHQVSVYTRLSVDCVARCESFRFTRTAVTGSYAAPTCASMNSSSSPQGTC